MSDIKNTKGVVAAVVTTGDVKTEFSFAYSNLRDYNSRNGFVNIEYKLFDAKLVEAGRDEVCKHALTQGYDWLLMIDADAALFPADTVARMLKTMYQDMPQLDVLGAYSTLKQPPYLPTIDTGTGKWETHYPEQGVLNVIRTGGHFIMVKTRILQRIKPPWFRTRIPYTPVKAFAELDNFARTALDGRNPLQSHPEWETLLAAARKASAGAPGPTNVGEDSGFCDAVKAAGGQIAVDTDIITGHVTNKVLTWRDLQELMNENKSNIYARCGVMNYV